MFHFMVTVTLTGKRLISKKKRAELKRRIKKAGLNYRDIADQCRPPVCRKMVEFVVNGHKASANVMGTIDRIAPPLETNKAAGNGENPNA